MTTPWEHITDDAYKNWLLSTPATPEQYNAASLAERRSLKTQYEQQQSLKTQYEQQQKEGRMRCCTLYSTVDLNTEIV